MCPRPAFVLTAGCEVVENIFREERKEWGRGQIICRGFGELEPLPEISCAGLYAEGCGYGCEDGDYYVQNLAPEVVFHGVGVFLKC